MVSGRSGDVVGAKAGDLRLEFCRGALTRSFPRINAGAPAGQFRWSPQNLKLRRTTFGGVASGCSHGYAGSSTKQRNNAGLSAPATQNTVIKEQRKWTAEQSFES